MRLIIDRSQEDVRGLMGGHKGVSFTLSYRLELTDEESELVERYKLGGYPLTWRSIQGDQMPKDTIDTMVCGTTQSVRDVTTLVRNENIIKDACDQLPTLFDVVRSFGGSEVIEYPRFVEA